MKFKKITILLLALACTLVQGAAQVKEEEAVKIKAEFKGLKKKSDELYVGQAADQQGKALKKFYLGMERVTDETLDEWNKFASFELSAGENKPSKKFSVAGLEFFERVLSDYQKKEISHSNELWVAYVSELPVSGKVINMEEVDKIKMFMTVLTSPRALLTTHMGISRTYSSRVEKEKLKGKEESEALRPDESIHLHSFAAKVMKERNPQRVYLFTFPNHIMRGILLKKLPANSIFVGDNFYEDELKKIESNPKLSPAKEFQIEPAVALLKTNPQRLKLEKKGDEISVFKIQLPNGKELVIDQKNPTYQWLFTDFFQQADVISPYVLIDLGVLAQVTSLSE